MFDFSQFSGRDSTFNGLVEYSHKIYTVEGVAEQVTINAPMTAQHWLCASKLQIANPNWQEEESLQRFRQNPGWLIGQQWYSAIEQVPLIDLWLVAHLSSSIPCWKKQLISPTTPILMLVVVEVWVLFSMQSFQKHKGKAWRWLAKGFLSTSSEDLKGPTCNIWSDLQFSKDLSFLIWQQWIKFYMLPNTKN